MLGASSQLKKRSICPEILDFLYYHTMNPGSSAWVHFGFIVCLYQFASEWGSNHCINDIYESADFMAG